MRTTMPYRPSGLVFTDVKADGVMPALATGIKESDTAESLPFAAGVRRELVILRCVNPCTNKALHIGHLRGASLAGATAATLRLLGRRYIRHCIFENIGAHMAFAVIGLRENRERPNEATPSSMKSDHRANEFYRRGRALCEELSNPLESAVPIEILREWTLGSPGVAEDAAEIQALATRGQDCTRTRFGIAFDACDFESAELPYALGLVEVGVQAGVFRRREDATVVFEKDGDTVELAYGTAALHESAYLLSFMARALRWFSRSAIHVAFAGVEWSRAMQHYREMLASVGVKNANRSYFTAFHGMVESRGTKLSSGAQTPPPLVDELLDLGARTPAIRRLADQSQGLLNADQIMSILTRVVMLGSPRLAPISFSKNAFIGPDNVAGWTIVKALVTLIRRTGMSLDTLLFKLSGREGRSRIKHLAEESLRSLSFDPVVGHAAQMILTANEELASAPLDGAMMSELLSTLSILGLSTGHPDEGADQLPRLIDLLRGRNGHRGNQRDCH
jgi:hypothetical protein